MLIVDVAVRHCALCMTVCCMSMSMMCDVWVGVAGSVAGCTYNNNTLHSNHTLRAFHEMEHPDTTIREFP